MILDRLRAWLSLRPQGEGEPASSVLPFAVRRVGDGPVISPGMPGLEGTRGENINGPSLIRTPEWFDPHLGRYYLYFAHHKGDYIRMAYADRLEGPWRIHAPGVLRLAETPAFGHIASPDAHVDDDRGEIRLYFHGCHPSQRERQVTYLATSRDGLRFRVVDAALGPFYFRVFEHGGSFYALAKADNRGGVLLRSVDGCRPFEPGPEVIPGMRHAAVLVRGDTLWIVYSRIGDAPERLLFATMSLGSDWRSWAPGPGARLREPETADEGAELPVAPSHPGRARGPVRQLRDPALLVEGDHLWLAYTVAGEQGIALCELGYRRPFSKT